VRRGAGLVGFARTPAQDAEKTPGRSGGFAVSRIRNETQRHVAALKSAGQSPIFLLPLDGGRGLGGHVEDDAVDLGHRVGDARGDAGQDVVGQARPVGRHRVLGGHGAQHDRVAVGAAITLDAHGTNVGEQDDRALPDLLIHTCSCVVRTKHANPLQAPRTKIPPAYND